MTGQVRRFDTGATRDLDTGKPDYEGFLSPLVIEAYGQYMHRHRQQRDGTLRASDNWQRGIPADAYMKSAWRHFMAWWRHHRGLPAEETLDEALCALIFNASGYLHERIKARLRPAEPAVCVHPAGHGTPCPSSLVHSAPASTPHGRPDATGYVNDGAPD